MPPFEQFTEAILHNFADLGDVATATRVGLRLVLAALLGGVLGYNRERMGKAAGVRTHMLVAIGSALFVIAPREVDNDPQAISRVIQGLVAGIGFLGAGAILKRQREDEIEGLTTAASIWTTAAIGVTVAMGRGSTAVVATVLSLFILRVLPIFGRKHNNNSNRPPSPPTTQ
jgi:putative Mg2+ transporter-C (MgtC) family protein